MNEQRVVVPAREGRAVDVHAGERVRIVDLEGGQVADLFAFALEGDEYLSAQHTRSVNSSVFPGVGDSFITNRRRPILRLVSDDTPGQHDMLIAACDPERYALLGCEGHHASCEENLLQAMATRGRPLAFVPQSVNLFMSIPIGSDGTLEWLPAPTAAGDSITFEAVIDCIVVVSACPQDVVAINHQQPGPVAIDVSVG